MQVRRRALRPGELDHEVIWLSVSLGSLALAATWFALGLPWPHCWFHDLTGLPCVTCGATRSTIEFFHGHPVAACRWNPVVFGFLCGLTTYDIYAFATVITRAPRLRLEITSAVFGTTVRVFAVVVLAANWVYLLSQRQAFT